MLARGTKPRNLELKTSSRPSEHNIVHLGDYEISMEDFAEMVEYVLTNTDLLPNDPRITLVGRLKRLLVDKEHGSGKLYFKFH